MHPDRISMHAIAWRVSCRYGLIVHVLVWHGSHAHTMASWSSSKLTQCSKAYVKLTLPWPERADADVSMAVCTEVVMNKLSPVPTDEQIALWREHLTSYMTVAVLASLEVIIFEAFCSCCGRLRRRMRKRNGLLHASGADACSNPARLRRPCRRRPGELQNRPHVRRTNVKVLLIRGGHPEMTQPL